MDVSLYPDHDKEDRKDMNVGVLDRVRLLVQRTFREGDVVELLGMDAGKPNKLVSFGRICFVFSCGGDLFRSFVPDANQSIRCLLEVPKQFQIFERAYGCAKEQVNYLMFPRFSCYYTMGQSYGEPELDEEDDHDVNIWLGTEGVRLFCHCFLHDIKMMLFSFSKTRWRGE